MHVVKYSNYMKKRDNLITKTKFDRIKNLKIKTKSKKINKSIFNLFNDEKKINLRELRI